MWSFGVLYFKILTGNFPFESIHNSKKELYYNILHQDLDIPLSIKVEDADILKSILKKEAFRRPNFSHLLTFFDYLI